MGIMGSSAVRAATFLSKNTNGRATRGSFVEASRRRLFFPEDVLETASEVVDAKSQKRKNRAVAVVDDLRVSDSIIMGTIPMRQFQYRSFWSWRGGEAEAEEDDTVPVAKAKTPVKEPTTSSKSSSFKKSEKYGNQRYKVSYSTEQGFRSYMEDEFFIAKNGDFCCCFDGHGGAAVSRYLRKNLYANVQAFLPSSLNSKRSDDTDGDNSDKPRTIGPTVEDYAAALQSALEKIDKEILRISHWSFQGSTAVVIWVHEEKMANAEDVSKAELNRTIIAANIGDSRAVLCRDNQAWNLTRDHKPNDPDEQERIEGLGGSVIWCGDVDLSGQPIEERGIYRVNGNLALSRAIGDRAERPHVTAEPEIIAVPVESGDEFIIIATDGLWDVMDSSDAVNYVKFALEAGLKKESVAHQMVQEALRRGTFDNVTVVIVWL